jgi:hypothetical protein
MTAFINVRFATSEDTVTLLNGAAVPPCAHPSTVPKTKAITITGSTAKRNIPVSLRMWFFSHVHEDSLPYGILQTFQKYSADSVAVR